MNLQHKRIVAGVLAMGIQASSIEGFLTTACAVVKIPCHFEALKSEMHCYHNLGKASCFRPNGTFSILGTLGMFGFQEHCILTEGVVACDERLFLAHNPICSAPPQTPAVRTHNPVFLTSVQNDQRASLRGEELRKPANVGLLLRRPHQGFQRTFPRSG